MLKLLGGLILSLIGLAMLGFALYLAWFVVNSDLWAWYATAGGLFSAAMLGFLGLTLALAPWRGRNGRKRKEGAAR